MLFVLTTYELVIILKFSFTIVPRVVTCLINITHQMNPRHCCANLQDHVETHRASRKITQFKILQMTIYKCLYVFIV